MPTSRETFLCRYHYDPLDRLAACTLSEQASTQRFYQKTRLATEIQGSAQRSIIQHDDRKRPPKSPCMTQAGTH